VTLLIRSFGHLKSSVLVAVALLAAALLAFTGCGYIGDPLPPLANVPTRVDDLAAVQRGSRIIAQFSVPLKTTEAHPIPPPLKFDLRAGTADKFEENQWAAQARQISQPALSGPVARYEIPASEWTGKEIIVGVRAVAGNGKQAPWSNFVVVPVVAAPETPVSVLPVAVPEGVRLTWQARGPAFRVFRKIPDQEFALLATVEKPEWLDTTVEFGQPYVYLVQTFVKLAEQKTAESELSAEAPITPRDTFPPAAPANIHASAAPNSIELNWERNTESDLAGYRVYRSSGVDAFVKIAEVSAIPSYSDRTVEHGKTYRYSVTAFDRSGNESQRSTVVEASLP
jgi:hypothetical protein